jgi:hypothetical protein
MCSIRIAAKRRFISISFLMREIYVQTVLGAGKAIMEHLRWALLLKCIEYSRLAMNYCPEHQAPTSIQNAGT